MKTNHNTSKEQNPAHGQEEMNDLHSLQVDILQVAVMEVEVTAVTLLISELHQVYSTQ